VTVVVRPDAVVSIDLDNADVCIGGVATLTATKTGGSSLAKYQWENSSSQGGPWLPIPGATNASYSAPTTDVSVIYYRVKIDDPGSDCADPASNIVSVTVHDDAEVTVSVNNASICVGGLATLTASMTGGSAQVSLQWEQ